MALHSEDVLCGISNMKKDGVAGGESVYEVKLVATQNQML